MSIPHLYFLFFFFFVVLVGTNNGNTTVSSCPSSHDCGNGIKISYPFWPSGLSISSQYCGYQGFGLECSNEGEPILILPPYTWYYVKNINYTNRTITIVDADIVGKHEGHCAKLVHNVTLNTVPLAYSPSVTNLSFYSNCIPYGNLSYVECLGLGPGGRRSYVSSAAGGFDDWYNNGTCEEKIVAPMMKNEMVNVSDDRDLIGKYGMILNAGVDLNWHTAEGCDSCEVNHGRCGYSYATGKLLCFCKDGTISSTNHCTDTPAEDNKGSFLPKLLIGLGAGITGLLFISIGIWCFLASWRRNRKNDQNIEDVIRHHGTLAPKRYTYSDIKKITDSFRDKLGQGGYGGVYKGKLLDGRLVAVKVLNESKGNGEEFINEVASISKTSHVNVVTLLGFCFEGPKRALVYEFMPNGSLEKFIYDEHPSKFHARHLGWEALYQIAIGIARGLEYLHRGCNTRILHFDIKPHNILLDEDFIPKIADFGLAKLCPKKESILSTMGARGTIGYIAPEVFYRNFGGVSHKSDVYSYGMMILEMFGGRKNISNVGESQTNSELYFPHCIYKRLELDNHSILEDHVMTEEENKIVRKMLLVGLWCIQTDPSQRPSIGKVMEMLEGSTEPLQIPPEPFLSSPPTLPENSFASPTAMLNC